MKALVLKESKKSIITAAEILKRGGVGVIPTDTLYGQLGQALNQKTVERIYQLRRRNPKKPMIVLISSLQDLNKFSIKLDQRTTKLLNRFWPGMVSVVLPCKNAKLKYLHRGTNSLAFRLPKKRNLVNLINITGPLVAPSANFEGQQPPNTITQARKNFGNNVDVYIDGGRKSSKPSTLIKLEKTGIIILRQGAVKIPK